MSERFEKMVAEISERMGEAVHNAWMEKRKKDKGWHNTNDCPGKTPDSALRMAGIDPKYPPKKFCDRCHPCMVPYKDLPDSEKELDREYPKLFFKILGDMGYQVIEVGKK